MYYYLVNPFIIGLIPTESNNGKLTSSLEIGLILLSIVLGIVHKRRPHKITKN